MKNYSLLNVEELATDSVFIEWVLAGQDEQLYNSLFDELADEKVKEAVKIVKHLKVEDIHLDPNEVESEIQSILIKTSQKVIPFYRKVSFRAAAILLVSFGLSLMYWNVFLNETDTVAVKEVENETPEVTFDSKKVSSEFVLPDGSSVTLEPNSTLTVAEGFNENERKVMLTGEALFNVAHNPSKPFKVVAGNTSTEVLGTSFTISAYEASEEVAVNVLRGKVKVISLMEKETEEVLLTPNQRAVYSKKSRKIKKNLSPNPILLNNEEQFVRLAFDETPINVIFESLENAYGIKIQYDEQKFKKCALTTRLGEESLFEKLDVICLGIGATYKVQGVQIVIEGGNC